jgi:hypothetical protein
MDKPMHSKTIFAITILLLIPHSLAQSQDAATTKLVDRIEKDNDRLEIENKSLKEEIKNLKKENENLLEQIDEIKKELETVNDRTNREKRVVKPPKTNAINANDPIAFNTIWSGVVTGTGTDGTPFQHAVQAAVTVRDRNKNTFQIRLNFGNIEWLYDFTPMAPGANNYKIDRAELTNAPVGFGINKGLHFMSSSNATVTQDNNGTLIEIMCVRRQGQGGATAKYVLKR